MPDKPLGLARSTETKYARVPLWLFETGVSLQALATYAWLHGQHSNYRHTMPSYQEIAEELGVSKPSAIAYVKELKTARILQVEPQFQDGGRIANRYTLAEHRPFKAIDQA